MWSLKILFMIFGRLRLTNCLDRVIFGRVFIINESEFLPQLETFLSCFEVVMLNGYIALMTRIILID